MSSSKKPRLIRDGDITIVEFGDDLVRLGEDVMPGIAAAVHDAGLAEPPWVLLDMTNVKFFGSSFIEVMYRLWKAMQARSGGFVIVGVHAYCLEVLQVTKLDQLWKTAPDRAAGLALLRKLKSGV